VQAHSDSQNHAGVSDSEPIKDIPVLVPELSANPSPKRKQIIYKTPDNRLGVQ